MPTVGDSAAVGASRVALELPAGYEKVPYQVVTFKLRRRAAARTMVAAAQIPTLTADVEVDLTAALQARAEWNASQPRMNGGKLSVLAFIAKAAATALVEHPNLNASYSDGGLLRWSTINLGVAVDAPAGLIVPVIRNAQNLNVQGIGEAIRDLAERARGRGIGPDDLAGGTFTISNPGAVGPTLRAEAFLNPPQVALLGLPGLRRTPIVMTDSKGQERIEIRSVVCPSLSFDHRALDGGEVIRYLTSLKSNLESWTMDDYLAAPRQA